MNEETIPEQEIINPETINSEVVEDIKILKPALVPASIIVHPVEQPMENGQCLIAKVDANGNEIAGTELNTSLRMFDKVYSKQSYILKKK